MSQLTSVLAKAVGEPDESEIASTERLTPVISDLREDSAATEDAGLVDTAAVRFKTVRSRRLLPHWEGEAPFEVLKNWEGVVKSVEEHTFFAAMRSTSSASQLPTDEFEIDLIDVPEGDKNLVRPGAIFYVTVGIMRPRGETPQKTTRIIFRRMPKWSKSDIVKAQSAADSLWHKLQQATGTDNAQPDSNRLAR